MPKWMTLPPASSMPAGTTSWRSTIAEAPAIRKMSQPSVLSSCRAPAMAWASCVTRRSPTSALPSEVSRLVVVPTALSRTLSRVPGSLVCTSPAFIALNGATETSGWLAEFATSSARANAVRGAA